jgi:hypothetical protein
MADPSSRSTAVIDRDIDSPAAWTGATVDRGAGWIPLERECLTEIETVAETLRANPLPAIALSPSDPVPSSREPRNSLSQDQPSDRVCPMNAVPRCKPSGIPGDPSCRVQSTFHNPLFVQFPCSIAPYIGSKIGVRPQPNRLLRSVSVPP